jgi:hypothetical protein
MSSSWDAATATLTVQKISGGTFDTATFERFLRALTFNNPSQNPTLGGRVITVFATDAQAAGPSADISINFVPFNQVQSVPSTR